MKRNQFRNRLLKPFLVLVSATRLIGEADLLLAQCTFSSGSTGADGDFNPTNSMPSTGWSVSGNTVTVTNSSDGIFNFRSIYIDTGWTVKFTQNTLNTPVYLLSQSNVTVKGTISVSGNNGASSPGTAGGSGGPGGFDGGQSGSGSLHGPGFGPGGGPQARAAGYVVAGASSGGSPYGVLDIRPFIGGSGGGGGVFAGHGGGGGGGALLIASSQTTDITGTVVANGGGPGSWDGGRGSGGSIRIMTDTLLGDGRIEAVQSTSGDKVSSHGRIRIEACNNNRAALTFPPATFSEPGSVFIVTNPTIQVTSIAGESVTWPPTGSMSAPDVSLPPGFTNPAVVSVLASNVSSGTGFKIIVTPAYGTNIVASSTLAGSYAESTGSVNVNVYTDRVWRVNAQIDLITRP